MIFWLAVISAFCLICGVVYPTVMAFIWILFYRKQEDFLEFMRNC